MHPQPNGYPQQHMSIPFVRSDGFIMRMFGSRDAQFFIESLLKMSANEVLLIANVPGWHSALMSSRPSVSDTPYDAVVNNHPLWVLDFIPSPMYHVVPQKIWSPPNQSDWRRYVEQAHLRMPVFFIQNNGAIGLPLPRATVGDTAGLRNADLPAPLGGGHSTQIRIAVSSPFSLSPSPPPLPLPSPPPPNPSLPPPFPPLRLSFGLKRCRIPVARIRDLGTPDTDQRSNATSQ
jgi:hypothetical protein